MIKFNKFNVTNGTDKANVHYSLDNRFDGRACVTIYAKDYNRALGHIFFEEYINNTDTMTDYFDKGRVVLFADHPLYAAARARAEDVAAEQKAKYEARRAYYADCTWVQGYGRPEPLWERVAGYALAFVIGVGMAALLVAWWSS